MQLEYVAIMSILSSKLQPSTVHFPPHEAMCAERGKAGRASCLPAQIILFFSQWFLITNALKGRMYFACLDFSIYSLFCCLSLLILLLVKYAICGLLNTSLNNLRRGNRTFVHSLIILH